MRWCRGFALSLRALLNHRVRTALAVVTVGIGVAAVVLTAALGRGAQRDVERGIDRMGVNLLVVRPVLVQRFAGRKELTGTVRTLRPEDADAIADLPDVAAAAPGIEGPGRVKADRVSTLTTIRGTTSAYPVIRRFRIATGRFFDADDDRLGRRVAVLGARAADALFTGDPVSREIRIRGIPFDVIGVLAARGAVADGDQDNQVVVPVRTALRRVFNTTWLNVIYVSARDARETAAEAAIAAALGRRHRPGHDGQADFEIQNAARFFAMQRQAADSLTMLGTGIAAVALAVGGLGVMGLMLLSVKERTAEVGLRMAVGAKPGDVLLQFLVESATLSLAGWVLGMAIAIAVAATVAAVTSWHVAASAGAVLASFGMVIIIGLGFGAVPARKAAMLPPVRALLTK